MVNARRWQSWRAESTVLPASMALQQLYGDDLAHIHREGYDFHWRSAAPWILAKLRQARMTCGMVVDLGCGGGEWLEQLRQHGYDVCGIDISAAMIRAARRRLPGARLLEGSFDETPIPPCDVVTSLGEPLCYLGNKRGIDKTFGKVARALRRGGLFVFDVRVTDGADAGETCHARVEDDWTCVCVTTRAPQANRLTRNVTVFRRSGKHFRRSDETHRLCVLSRKDIKASLRKRGFRVRVFNGYGNYTLGADSTVFVARKSVTAAPAAPTR